MRFDKLLLPVVAVMCVFIGFAADRASATCANQGVKVMDPAPTEGPLQQCSDATTTWWCDTFWQDILPYQACDTPGSHPGWECVVSGWAQKMVITYSCGSSNGSCPSNGPNQQGTTIQDHLEQQCPAE